MRLPVPLALLLLLLPLAVWAQAPQAPAASLPEAEPLAFEGRVEPERVLLGEPFVYTLTVTHKPEERYELALPPDLGAFELLSQSRQRKDSGDSSTTTFELRLSAFELGTLTLPEVPFTVATPSGPLRFSAPGRTLEVAGTLPEDTQEQGAGLKDIQPPTEVAIRSWRLVWALLGLVAGALLGWALVRWVRRGRPAQAPLAPLLPLDVRTRQSLEQLEADDLPGKGRVREFYFRLSEILRAYLGERYGFEALECTSPELLVAVRRLKAPGLPEEELERFISESDLIKFARGEASPETCREALAFGYTLLEKTWPPHVPGPSVP